MLVGDRGLLDLGLHVPALDRRDRPADVLDAVDDGLRGLLELVRERLDVVRAGEGIDRVGRAGLVGDDLLRAQRELLRLLGRQRQRLVVARERERLHAADDGREGLDRRAREVIERLLRGQRRAAGLRVRAEHHGVRAGRAVALLHRARPHPAEGAELGDLLEEVVVRVEDPRHPRRHVVDRRARRDAAVEVGEGVGERERDLLCGRRAGLADVVAGDGDRVEARRLGGAVVDEVRRQPHRGPRREDVGPARDVLLEHVVLRGAHDHVRLVPLLLRRDDVHRHEDRRGRVDRHRGRDAVQRDVLEQRLHVGEAVDRHAHLADLAGRHRVVRVVAGLRRQVERRREPGLAVGQQLTEALVGLLGGSEAGVLAHGPEPPAVHRRLHAARERVLAREPDVVEVVDTLDIERCVEPLRLRRGGLERLPALGEASEDLGQRTLFPRALRILDCGGFFRPHHGAAPRTPACRSDVCAASAARRS